MTTSPPSPLSQRPGAPAPGRCLITGGAGFIGSHLCDRLLAAGEHVTVVDNLSTGRRDNLPMSHPRLTFIHADLARALPDLAVSQSFDRIYHLAAAVGVRLVVDDPVGCIRTNIDDTLRILEFALTSGPGHGPSRTLIASSSEVYGKAETSPFSEDDDVVYGPTTRSRWSYACSKAIDEYLALAHHDKHHLPVVIARFFNTVGPRQLGSYGMVLPNFVASALKNAPVRVFGDGHQTRCFCDVRDVVGALPRLIDAPACTGRVFNVGSDRSISMNDLAALVISTLSSRSSIEHVPYDQAYAAGFEDLRRREPDLRRIQQAVGFVPSLGLETTIRDLAQWMVERRVLETTVS